MCPHFIELRFPQLVLIFPLLLAVFKQKNTLSPFHLPGFFPSLPESSACVVRAVRKSPSLFPIRLNTYFCVHRFLDRACWCPRFLLRYLRRPSAWEFSWDPTVVFFSNTLLCRGNTFSSQHAQDPPDEPHGCIHPSFFCLFLGRGPLYLQLAPVEVPSDKFLKLRFI